MSLLREILTESFLLKEDASVDAINNAIRNMHPVWVTYKGPAPGGKNRRLIYPVAYGVSTAGNPVVRAFQPQGSTSTEVPAWKFFRLDRIGTWRNINSKTFDPGELNGFNDKGDEQMETLYTIAPIGNAPTTAKPQTEKPETPEKIITTHPVGKSEVENGGADKNTERDYYTANDAVRDILQTTTPKVAPSSNKNIDNVAGQDYNSKETQPVQDTIPVTKQEVDPNAENEPTKTNPVLYATNDPVMKSDLEPEEDVTMGPVNPEEEEKNSLSESFLGLMRRMDGLYKDEEE